MNFTTPRRKILTQNFISGTLHILTNLPIIPHCREGDSFGVIQLAIMWPSEGIEQVCCGLCSCEE